MKRLHTTENPCCSHKENLKPTFVVFDDGGYFQIGVTNFCEKCGWISLKQFYSSNGKNSDINSVTTQELFNKLTDKVDYICFLDKNPDNGLLELMGKELLLFKTQRIKK